MPDLPEERLASFEDAIRTVYASMMNPSALDYRLRRGLDQRDEQMALLVQRVSGSYYGDYFMPCAAGVGYSYSAYRFLEELDPSAGMLRLVMGLGTTAVDQTGGSYPRLVSLDKPAATSFHSEADHHRHCQQQIGVVNRQTRQLDQMPLMRIEKLLPPYLKRLLLTHDREVERTFRNRGIRRDVLFISCTGLTEHAELMKDLKDILALLQKEYGIAVDIEYSINLAENKEYVINLLQCRPLATAIRADKIVMPDEAKAEAETAVENKSERYVIDGDTDRDDLLTGESAPGGAQILLDCRGTSMGNSLVEKVDGIVWIDPVAYYEMPHHEKTRIARVIHDINWYYRGRKKTLMLMAPGRVGTSSPELGVPVVFADISEFSAIFELAESRAGYQPELSYGSHFFQDLVENEILYAAVFEDERTVAFHPERIRALPNRIAEVVPEQEAYAGIVGLYEMEPGQCMLYHDMQRQRIVCTF